MSTVIKIKFGDTMRRMYEKDLDFTMVMLRENICNLFGLNPDADFTITYIDEDGDVTTLCDDGDLDELADQCLNPIRMTVTLNPETQITKPSLESTEKNSNPSMQSLNSAVSVILKFVPERRHNELLKLLLDVAWENMMSGSDMGVKIDEASEPVKKDGGLENLDLNVPYSESESVKLSVNDDMDVKGSDTAQMKKSVDFDTCVDRNECPFIGNCISPLDCSSLAIHEDIMCDGCGVSPITGPRFMSKWIGEFDLCFNCFEKTGHDASDYIRMDFSPASKKADSECNDEIDPEVANQESEVCEKKSNGVVEFEELFFDAQPNDGKGVKFPSKLVESTSRIDLNAESN